MLKSTQRVDQIVMLTIPAIWLWKNKNWSPQNKYTVPVSASARGYIYKSEADHLSHKWGADANTQHVILSGPVRLEWQMIIELKYSVGVA